VQTDIPRLQVPEDNENATAVVEALSRWMHRPRATVMLCFMIDALCGCDEQQRSPAAYTLKRHHTFLLPLVHRLVRQFCLIIIWKGMQIERVPVCTQ